ncbi:MAG: hypothetical protein HUJ31_07040, partial [Pseudomonadales bacterium]|nr:hypothetical protein [Pseudomonadales bacterium]
FNLENIIWNLDTKRVYLVEVHRSSYGDYGQDVAVFLVSNFRVPIFSRDIRRRLNAANERMFDSALAFARASGDKTFEARLGRGLFRSMITSTRFLFDKQFSADMFYRGTLILRELLNARDDPESFTLRREYFLYE